MNERESITRARQGADALRLALGEDKPRPDAFPGYEVLRELRRGAQGVVYQAVQRSTKRMVAIKVMREGPFTDRREKARFDREVEVLGQLHHPNIVTIHDSGTAAGQVYFVMDYIAGQRLHAAPFGADRSVDPALRLFVKICDAVNAAHLQGVIHRDLKPGNILVDADGEPHILDFGLAKVAAGDAEASMMTITGQFLGSLPWASPEQAEGIPGKIDMRTDVYSLGVLLYQMLTGRFPYPITGGTHEVLNNIRQTEPAKPSAIRREIDDETETIVLKCLQKEREQRYQSAGELARDVRRRLAGEAIQARPPHWTYTFRVFARRHRAFLAGVAAVFVALAAGLIASSLLYVRAERARADAARDRDRAVVAERTAQAKLTEAEAVSDVLQKMLSSADPHEVKSRDYTVLQALDGITQGLGDQLAGQPEIEVRVRLIIGKAYRNLGEYDLALPHLKTAADLCRRHFGDKHALLGISLYELGWLVHHQGDYAAAEKAFRDALAVQEQLFGREHSDVAASLVGLADILKHAGAYDQAEVLFREALAIQRKLLGADHPLYADNLHDFARFLDDRGEYAASEPLYREVLDTQRKAYGKQHPTMALTLSNLASSLRDQGKTPEAEEMYQQSIAMYRALLGEAHPFLGRTLRDYAWLLEGQGDLAGAEQLHRQSLDVFRRHYGAEAAEVAAGQNYLGSVIERQGDPLAAEPLHRSALAVQRKLLGPEHVDTLKTRCDLGVCLTKQTRFEEAEPELLAAYAGFTALEGNQDAWRAANAERLAELYTAWGKPETAAQYRPAPPVPRE